MKHCLQLLHLPLYTALSLTPPFLLLPGALKTYRYCRQKAPQLQTELTQVNAEIAKRNKELESLREEFRDTCNKEERLRRKRDRLGAKYEDTRKRAKFCKEALAIIPLVYDQKKPTDLEEEDDDAIQEELSDGDEELPPSPPADHTPSSDHAHSPQEGIVAEEEEDSNPAPPLEDIPIGPSIASSEVPTSSPSRGGVSLTPQQSPLKKEGPRLLLSPRRLVSIDTGSIIKSPVHNVPQPQKDPTSPIHTHKSPEHKVVSSFPKETVKRTPADQPDVDEMEDDLEDLDDLDDLEDGSWECRFWDDEDSDDSDASGHFVIETMELQGQKARNSGEEFDHDYMPSGMDEL